MIKKIMKNKIVFNYLYNSIYQLLAIIIPIITIPYVSRVLGAEGMGIYGYTSSVAQFFYVLGMFGINSYGSREIAYIRNNKEDLTRRFWNIWFLQLATGAIGLIIYLIIIIYFNVLNYKIAFLFQVPLLLNAIFDISWFFIAIEDFKKTVTRNIVIKIIGLILIFMFVKNSNDVYKYIFINSSVIFIGSLTLWPFLKGYVTKIKLKNINLSSYIKGAFLMLIPQLAIQIYTSLDRTVIGNLSDVSQVGYYDQSQKIARIALAVVTSLSVVLMPRIANMHARNEKEKVEEYIIKSVNFTLASSIFIMAVIIGTSKNFVPWFFGKEFTIIVPYMMLTSFIVLFIALGGVFANQYTLPTNKNKEYIIPLLLASIINVSLNFILVPKYKALGGVISIVITELVVCLLRIILVRKYLNIKKIFKNTYVYFLSGFAVAISTNIIGEFFKVGFLGLIIQGIWGMIIYFLCLYIIDSKIREYVNYKLIRHKNN